MALGRRCGAAGGPFRIGVTRNAPLSLASFRGTRRSGRWREREDVLPPSLHATDLYGRDADARACPTEGVTDVLLYCARLEEVL